MVHIDPSRTEQIPTTSEKDSDPSLSGDKTLVVFVRGETEVWIMRIDGSMQRRIFSCSGGLNASCRTPQFSPDHRFVHVVRDISDVAGDVWRIGSITGTNQKIISDSAKFGVLQTGKYRGSIVADQLTLSRDAAGDEYETYPFFLFTTAGSKIGAVADDVEYLPDLIDELGRS